MTQKDNILQELTELNSSLAKIAPANVYAVPGGYFDELPVRVLNRIKAMTAVSGSEELGYLSPFLQNTSREMPFTVPQNYFEETVQAALESVRAGETHQTVNEELASLSPFLSGLKKEMPYAVPQGYFASLPGQANKPETKVVSLTHRIWFRYAAAAVITGIIAMASFLYITKNKIDPTSNSHAWVKKNIKKVSNDKLEEFIELVEDDNSIKSSLVTTGKTPDIKDLIKDVPENEIQSLLNDTDILYEPGEVPAADETMMN